MVSSSADYSWMLTGGCEEKEGLSNGRMKEGSLG